VYSDCANATEGSKRIVENHDTNIAFNGRNTYTVLAYLLWCFNSTVCQFTFWISLSLRSKTETKRLNFGLSLVRVAINQGVG